MSKPSVNPSHPNSDLLLVSPYSIANESNINVTRIKKIIFKSIEQWLQSAHTVASGYMYVKHLKETLLSIKHYNTLVSKPVSGS